MRTVLCLLFLSNLCRADHPLVNVLKNSPEVATVENPIDAPHCIIHIRDWHWVPYEYVAAELPEDTPSEVVAATYVDHLNKVRKVQQEQFTLLKRLIDRDVLTVYREGLTPDIQPVYRALSQVLWMRHQQIPEVGDELFKRPNVLSLGVPGRLIAKGHLKTAHAADTDRTLALTDPLQKNGRLRDVTQADIEKREDHMVRRMLNHKGHCVIILGGAHDLTDNVKRLGNGNTGLIVVTTRAFRKHEE